MAEENVKNLDRVAELKNQLLTVLRKKCEEMAKELEKLGAKSFETKIEVDGEVEKWTLKSNGRGMYLRVGNTYVISYFDSEVNTATLIKTAKNFKKFVDAFNSYFNRRENELEDAIKELENVKI